MLKLNQAQAVPAIGGFVLAHVDIHFQGAKPILRATFLQTDTNGNVLPLSPVVHGATDADFDALVRADANPDSLRTRLYKSLASTLGVQSTISADAAAPAQPAQAQAVAKSVTAPAATAEKAATG